MAISTFSVFVPTSSEIQSVASDKISLTSLLNLFRGKDNHFFRKLSPLLCKYLHNRGSSLFTSKKQSKCTESKKND